MKNKFIIVLVLLACRSQSLYSAKVLDSIFIQKFPTKMMIKPFMAHNFMAINYDLPRSMPVLTFKPNNSFDFGLGFSYKWFTISYALGVFDVGDPKRYGKTTDMDFAIHIFAKKHVADIAYQNYKGFYVSNIADVVRNWDETKPYPQRRDMEINSVTLNYQYVFNGKKLSYVSAFAQTEKQLRSVGSPLVGVTFSYFDMHSDSTLLPIDHNKKDSLKADDHFVRGNFICPGIKAGYAYNLVIAKNLAIFMSIVPGMTFEINQFYNKDEVKKSDKDGTKKPTSSLKANFQVHSRLAMVYQRDRFMFGGSFYPQYYTHRLKDAGFSFFTARAEIFFGYRFDAPKFLRGKQ